MNTFDSGHFDIRGCGGAGNCGDWMSFEWFHPAEGFGHGFEYLIFEDYAEVVIGNESEGTASFG